MESILTSIKKLLGIVAEDTHFDADIIIHINSALMTLNQLGVGPEEGFSILSELETWENFLGDSVHYEAIKTYVYYYVRTAFDPPINSAVLESMHRRMNELEWRLQVQKELKNQ